MEIEKKYLINKIPEDLDQYETWEIEQYYLCSSPVIRIRKKNDQYIFTYKNHVEESESSLCVSEETELSLTEEAFYHLKQKADGIPIQKTRYRIPYKSWIIELDIFHGAYEGLSLAEVEFASIDEGNMFEPPLWFSKDVSSDVRYTNSYLSQNNENIRD